MLDRGTFTPADYDEMGPDSVPITATDDGLCRTHDDAQSLIRYAVPGASVTFHRPPTASDRTRAYEITMRRHGRPDVATHGAYTIPAPVESIANGARSACDAVASRK